MQRRLLCVALMALCALEAQDRPRRYQARLLDPVGSESVAGSTFTARIVGPLNRQRPGALPPGTLLHGKVRRAESIGLGFKRERALLELEFGECVLPAGEPVECHAELLDVDNAREVVRRPGRVEGIVAASHPHSWLSGVWLRPTPAVFGKSALGLTGAGGMVHARLLPHPLTGAVIIAARVALMQLPDAEIRLPSGVDLIVSIRHASQETPPDGRYSSAFPESVLREVSEMPVEITQQDRAPVADIVNLALQGSREDIENSFTTAGWTAAETLNAKTFARTYAAFASMKSYAAAPVSTLLYRGRPPDLVFQKSFNTLGERHHIRLWREEVQGETFWLGAATHDVSIALDWGRLSLTHKIDPRIDIERSFVLNDLEDAGCAGSVEIVERPELEAGRTNRTLRVTDGALAVVKLRTCSQPMLRQRYARSRDHRIHYRLTRRIVLESRNYVVRGNPYYYAFRAIRWKAERRELDPRGDR